MITALAMAALFFLPITSLPVHAEGQDCVRLLKDSQFFDVLRDHIADATQEIVVSMFLFKTGQYSTNRANHILENLITAQKRGVNVWVLLEKSNRPGNSLDRENGVTSKRLRQNGVQVLFDSPKKTTHTKTIVIDKRFVFIGSHNLTHSALFYNHELSVLIDDPDLARVVIRYVQELAS
jgi:phosphatidylserine/phosphatidylglycerophosphate/cardiolipin synthase-like enzyme